jgi:hypothetical protein
VAAGVGDVGGERGVAVAAGVGDVGGEGGVRRGGTWG